MGAPLRTGAIEIAEESNLRAVVHLLVDQNRKHPTSRPINSEVRRSQFVQRDVVELSKRLGDGTLALDEVLDCTVGVAVRNEVPEVADLRSKAMLPVDRVPVRDVEEAPRDGREGWRLRMNVGVVNSPAAWRARIGPNIPTLRDRLPPILVIGQAIETAEQSLARTLPLLSQQASS